MRFFLCCLTVFLSCGLAQAEDTTDTLVLPKNFYLLKEAHDHISSSKRVVYSKTETTNKESTYPTNKIDGYISLGFGGWSDHDTGNKPNLFNERNTVFEVGYKPWGTRPVFIGGKPFLLTGRVFENSRYGKTDYVSLGNEWHLIQGNYVGISLGLGAMHVRYEDGVAKPGKRRFAEGTLPLVYASLDFQKIPISLRVVPLGDKITFYYIVYHF